jgi:hypothetical protein
MSKYAPLENHLSAQAENSVALSYESIEKTLGFKLPNSAYKHRAWWSNGKKGGSKFWLRVGWMVESVRLGESVTFARMDQAAESRHRDTDHGHEEEFLEVMVSLDLADIPSLIKDLQALMVEGLLTREEFEEKKANLLGML